MPLKLIMKYFYTLNTPRNNFIFNKRLVDKRLKVYDNFVLMRIYMFDFDKDKESI